MPRITRRTALAQPNMASTSRSERPEMPFELIRMVLERLPWNENPWWDGKELHWQGFLALRRTSRRIKGEIEALKPSWVYKLALEGMLVLMRACTSRDLPPAAIQHYALLERVHRAQLDVALSTTGIAPQRFRQVLELLPNLTDLDLTQQGDVDDEYFVGAALSPESLPRLRTLSLGWTGITAVSLPAIGRLLPALEELDLTEVDLHGDLDGLGIEDALRLRRLFFGRCNVHRRGLHKVAVLLARTTVLEQLELEGNYMGPAGASAFGVALSVNRSLKVLNLRDCSLSDRGVEALGLHRHKTIADLCLMFSELVLCRGLDLSLMPSLVKLDLYGNYISPEGIRNLNLGHNTTLRELNLTRSRLTERACGMLGGQLETSALRSLFLAGNNISDAGLAALRLQSSPTLVEVDLSYNDISDKGVRSLRLRENRVLRELSLCNDDGTRGQVRRISKAAAAMVFSDPSQVVVLGTYLDRIVRVHGGMNITRDAEIQTTSSN